MCKDEFKMGYILTTVWDIIVVLSMVLTSIFALLKLSNTVEWSWLIVLLPLIIFVSLLTLCFVVLLIWAYFVSDDYE